MAVRNHLFDLLTPNLTSSPTVSLECGTSSITTALLVHESLLRKRSRYCSSLLQQADMIDANFSKVIRLEHSAEVVEMYTGGLYADELLWIIPPAAKLKGLTGTDTLAKVFVLAEFLQDVQTKNAIVGAMVEASNANGMKALPSASQIAIVYAGTQVDSPMRRLLVDVVAGSVKEHWFQRRNMEELPSEFLIDFARAIVKGRNWGNGKTIDVQNYIEVEDDVRSA